MRIKQEDLDKTLSIFQSKANDLKGDGKKVSYEYFIDRDNLGEPKIEKVPIQSGTSEKPEVSYENYINIYVAYIREPHFLASISAMDLMLSGAIYKCGNMLWSACVLEESDSEIFSNEDYKLGLLPKLSTNLKVQAPEIKKN